MTTAMLRRLLILPALVAGLMLLAAPTALAHATVVATSPGDGQVVASAPRQVSVTFDEPVELQFGALRVFAPGGARVDTGSPGHPSGRADIVETDLAGGLGQGTYTVAWRVISADSHPVQGAFTFSIGKASTSSVTSATLDAAGSKAVGVAFAVVRAVAYAAFAVLVGVAAFAFACWPLGAGTRSVRRMLVAGWAVLVAATLAALALQGPYGAGFGMSRVLDLSVLRTTLSTRLGTALAARLVLLGLAAGLLAWVFFRLPGASRRTRASVGAAGGSLSAALATTWAAADHAGTGSQVAVALPIDVVHLSAMAVWVGGLVVMAGVVLRGGDGPGPDDIAAVVRRFSAIALSCVIVLVASGSYQAWRQVGTLSALTGTAYGRLLIVKLLGVATLIGLGYVARLWIAEHLRAWPDRSGAKAARGRPGADAIRVLRRSVAAEVAVAAGVLAVTAGLVNAPPARTAYAAPVSASAAFDTGGPNGSGTVQVIVDPAKIGTNAVHVYVLGATGEQEAVQELDAALSLPSRSVGPLALTLQNAGPGHYTGQALIPIAGTWQLSVIVRTDAVDETTVRFPVTIR